MKNTKPLVTIVGSGFSGLTLAYFLFKEGFPVQVIHEGPIGGMLQTEIKPEMQIEAAANSLLMSKSLEILASEVGCPLLSPQKSARAKFIYRGGPRRWPLSFFTSIKLFTFFLPRFLFFKSKLTPSKNETVEAWAKRAFNDEILQYLISPFLQGIYAGDVQKLSASLVFSKKSESSKRQIVAPPQGLHQLMSSVAGFLKKSGVVFIQKKVQSLSEIQNPKVLAVAFRDLQKLDPNLDLTEINQLEIVRVTLGFKKVKHKIFGFGVLFPSIENMHSLGVLVNSQIFENRGDFYNESWILGGALNPDINQSSDKEILEKIKQDRFKMFDADESWDCVSVIRWPKAYVHYDLKLEEWLSSNPFKKKDYFVTGNFLGGLGLSKILDNNKNLAKKLAGIYG